MTIYESEYCIFKEVLAKFDESFKHIMDPDPGDSQNLMGLSLLTDTFDSSIDIIENKTTVDNITKKINLIYKEIKKNEQRPATDYLFNGLEKSNREKTFEKLEALNKLNTVIRS